VTVKSVLALLISSLVLAGCAAFDGPGDKAVRTSPSFKAGYEDGCAAATYQGADLRDRPVGDKDLYANDEAYRAGYGSGFSICRRTNMQPGTGPGDNPVNLPGPGH
jgi:hypothetical protein